MKTVAVSMFLFCQALCAPATDIAVVLRWNPIPSPVPQISIAAHSAGADVPTAPSGDQWVVQVPERGLYVVTTLSSTGSLPTQYAVGSMTQYIPYYRYGRRLSVDMVPTKIEHPLNPAVADRMFATDVQNLSLGSLAGFHQGIRSVALAHIDHRGEDWDRLHGRDVQSVYKFLETAVVLWKKGAFLEVDQADVTKCREWLHSAAINNSRVTRNALDFSGQAIKTLEDELAGRQGMLFGSLWRQILEERDLDKKCALLEQYDSALREHDDYEALVKVTRVTTDLVISARANCAASRLNAARAGRGDFIEAHAQLEAVRAAIEARLQETAGRSPEYLASDRASLTALAAVEPPQL